MASRPGRKDESPEAFLERLNDYRNGLDAQLPDRPHLEVHRPGPNRFLFKTVNLKGHTSLTDAQIAQATVKTLELMQRVDGVSKAFTHGPSKTSGWITVEFKQDASEQARARVEELMVALLVCFVDPSTFEYLVLN